MGVVVQFPTGTPASVLFASDGQDTPGAPDPSERPPAPLHGGVRR